MSGKEVHAARRDLYREAMDDFGSSIDWLMDPEAIPADAASLPGMDTTLPEKCGVLAMWVSAQLGQWTSEVHGKLKLKEAFEKHDLTNPERVLARVGFQKEPFLPYVPGLLAIGGIFSVVPEVAAREGRPREDWRTIGTRASSFGDAISRYGTDAQGVLMNWLSRGKTGSFPVLDPAKIKTDSEMGITTTTPFDDVLGAARDVANDLDFIPGERTCVALQARSPVEGFTTLFEAVWDRYGIATDRLIYPSVPDIDPTTVPPEAEPWKRDELYDHMTAVLVRDQNQRTGGVE